MAIDEKVMGVLRQENPTPDLDLSWLTEGTWGAQAKPGRRGLTLDEVGQNGSGQAPDMSRNMTAQLRGMRERPQVPRLRYPIQAKADVWSQNAAMLYEEAVQRQWSSATDIPWTTLKPLSDDMERAMCQLCTFLTEVEFIAGDTPGQWLPKISNDHYETKLFLMTQIMDEARHLDVFRKRALANGGGLLKASPTTGLRDIIDAKDFTEMSAIMHVLGEGFVQSMFRMGELIAQNEAEKRIFRLCAQDESRHLGFGVMHLKYTLEAQPERKEEIHAYLDKAENVDPENGTFGLTTAAALIVLLGGGKDKTDEGFRVFMALRRRQLEEYLHRLEVAGLGERRERINAQMQYLMDMVAA